MARKRSTRPTTSVVGTSGGARTSTLQSGGAPYREELYSAESLATPAQVAAALQKLSRHVAEATAPSRSLPIHGGAYFPEQKLMANVALTIAHGVDSPAGVAWLAGSVRTGAPANASVAMVLNEVGQDVDHGLITFSSTVNLLCDIWCFPRPVAEDTPSPAPSPAGGGGLSPTGVTAGAYGDSTHVGAFTVEADGRLTAAANVAIAFPGVAFTGGNTSPGVSGGPAEDIPGAPATWFPVKIDGVTGYWVPAWTVGT